ncbi:Cardioacceleratory peptide receptor [Gryllus bimaculatus]|nr:Cardioacceleratory peptide receptor [Gryllus bimaculatus]
MTQNQEFLVSSSYIGVINLDRGAGGGGSGGGDERLGGRLRLRRSDMSNIERARARTLRMTITIVAAFIWCWTPYVVMTLWYMFDRESAKQVDSRVQDALFIMAVSNSCMNPLVYGSYALNCRRDCARCCACALRPTPPDPLMRKSTVGSATRSTAAPNGNSLTTAAALGVGVCAGAGVGRTRLLPDVLPAYRQV